MEFFWIGVIIVAVIVEVLTPGIISIWFAPAGLVAMVLALLGVEEWIQILTFLVLSILCIIFARPLFSRRCKTLATNVDAIIGERALVVEKIENIAGAGQVKVRGQSWSARAAEEETVYEVGDIVTVIAVEGVKLICK